MMEDTVSPDPKQWRSWSKSQRQEWVQQFRVVTSQMRKLWDQFDTMVQVSSHMGFPVPYYHFLTGVSGTGKTTLIQMWREHAAPDIPSLYMVLLPPISFRHFIAGCLAALGDPEPGRGTTWQMQERLIQTIKATEVRILFLDEMDHLIKKTGSPAFSETGAAILSFIDQLAQDFNLTLVLVGLLEEAEWLLQANPKLTRRMQAPQLLGPYSWDASRPETIRDFCCLMHAIDEALPLDWSGLGTEEMAFRFFFASDGNLRRVMRLVRSAALQAIEEDATTLSLEALAQVYEHVITSGSLGEQKPNPFREKFI